MAITLGILGAGQLAQMIAASTDRTEYRILLYAQSKLEPACVDGFEAIIGEKNDQKLIEIFFQKSDVIILESEFYSFEFLKSLQDIYPRKIIPELESYKELSNKKHQKQFFDRCGIKYAKSILIQSENDLQQLEMPGPYMVKRSSGGYDGYGNKVVESLEGLKKVIPDFSNNFQSDLLVEEKVEILSEYACMLIKGIKNSVILPACKTIQRNSVCELVEFPADLDTNDENSIIESMQKIDDNLKGIGVFAFEFFKTKNGILINEAAPRVHNSYHFSMEGFEVSQFDYITKILNDDRLEPVRVKYSNLSMVNILGQSNTTEYHLIHPELPEKFGYKLHMYKKHESRKGRKLGHLTIFGNDKSILEAQKLNDGYRI